ncbi:beta-propeller fold lactonase family protein [Alterisphingorhabdus coralli]|uniref:Beta-propeller fold lactonase family protein n=1 Tax=Alterisphingorhabdus coralli TaxID=3071408 RepID=A0AA97F786_9SPHN|nr:beta-propeller fold lactonase family protein [Parasphingorhabdus sp. SCSIO 66989]WOE74382.1 beta-propeller fold lactonase family protein [Parasphingorhabdus sp. SCSIO 66989]
MIRNALLQWRNLRLIMPLLLAPLLAACGAQANQPDSPAQADASITGTLVVGNKGEDTVSFVDLASGEEIKRVETGPQPHEVAISPNGLFAAVAAYGGETIDIFSINDVKVLTGRRLARIDLVPNTRPHGVLWLSDNLIMATTEGSDTLTTITFHDCKSNEDCPAFVHSVSAVPTENAGSHMLAASADGSMAYVANLQSKNVSVINVTEGKHISDLVAGTEPEGIALSPDGKELWVSARGSDEVFVFDTETLEQKAKIASGRFPLRLAISPDGKYAVTSDLVDGGVSVYDTATKERVRSITVSGEREAAQVTVIFSPDGKRLYLAETGQNTIAEIDFASGKLLRRFAVGEKGDGLGMSPIAITQ